MHDYSVQQRKAHHYYRNYHRTGRTYLHAHCQNHVMLTHQQEHMLHCDIQTQLLNEAVFLVSQHQHSALLPQNEEEKAELPLVSQHPLHSPDHHMYAWYAAGSAHSTFYLATASHAEQEQKMKQDLMISHWANSFFWPYFASLSWKLQLQRYSTLPHYQRYHIFAHQHFSMSDVHSGTSASLLAYVEFPSPIPVVQGSLVERFRNA
mmetsp:Transcript_9271/g.13968  ORF Transcript_9271/g.13968 Transcript_9271/m.13968 type:complete len:206 (+) Transcript_9271:727-1344(+)